MKTAILGLLLVFCISCAPAPAALPASFEEVLAAAQTRRQTIVKPTLDDLLPYTQGRTPAFDREDIERFLTPRPQAGFISIEDAIADVEDLFTLLRDTYGGYVYFGGDGVFEPAKQAIIGEIRRNEGTVAFGTFERAVAYNLSTIVHDQHFATLNRDSGFPVARITHMGFSASDSASGGVARQFLGFAEELRGEPVVIVDLRGNPGGSGILPMQWLHIFTGEVLTPNFLSLDTSAMVLPIIDDEGNVWNAGTREANRLYWPTEVIAGGASLSLPRSGLPFSFGTALLHHPPGHLDEGVGLEPDIWVAGDALTAVAAMLKNAGFEGMP